MNTRIRHVSFDLWKTLIVSHPEYKNQRTIEVKNFIKQKSGFTIPFLTLDEQIRRYEKALDMIMEENGHQISIETIYRGLCTVIGLDTVYAEELNKRIQALTIVYCPKLMDSKEIMHILTTLKSEGISMSIGSNTAFISGNTLGIVLDRLNILQFFAFSLFSDQWTYCKPHYEFFAIIRTFADRFSPIDPDEILHIGDNPRTDGKATNNSINTMIINHESTNLKISHVLKYIKKLK